MKQQLAAVSAALGFQRSDWECKEGEVKPACKKTVLLFKSQSVHIPSAAESQSATSAGSDPGTT